MAFRPNFTALESDGDTVFVRGVSDADEPGDLGDILDISVVLVQADRIARGSVDKIASDWVARLPVSDPDGAGGDFRDGDAVAFGIEARRMHATTITWTQTMPIVPVEP
jgi:hypothetical protein